MEKIRLVEANKEVNLFDLKCIKKIFCVLFASVLCLQVSVNSFGMNNQFNSIEGTSKDFFFKKISN